MTGDDIRAMAKDDKLITAGSKAIADVLVGLRDNHVSIILARSGLVVQDADGGVSPVIRLTIREAVAIALRGMADQVEAAKARSEG